ncbi:MAG TPA: polyprenyl synthetase family protein [Firmicutes bacterium]|nr:polyprenyl synthetase family protein [Bacillota bacterium]
MDAFAKIDSSSAVDSISARLANRTARSDYYFRPDSYVENLINRVEKVLEEMVASDIDSMETIGRHMLFGYAKRLRPTFILLTQQLFKEEILESTVECAAAAELIHCASLFHDDVIDSASTRKGKKSANAIWGNKSAVIMGDRFFVLAYILLAKQRDFRILDIFVDTCRSLADGIMLEMGNTGNMDIGEATHFEIITKKTANFFRNMSFVGGYLARTDEGNLEQLSNLGLNFGLAFQHSDDLLDLFADPDATGKPRGSDLMAGLFTTPIIYALATNPGFVDRFAPALRARSVGETEINQISAFLKENGAFDYVKGLVKFHGQKAMECLDRLPECRANDSLRNLVTRIVERDY